MRAPTGFVKLTVWFDLKADRKSGRVWKLTLPLNADNVESVPLRTAAPDGKLAEGAESTVGFEAAITEATEALRKLGVEPVWTRRVHPLDRVPFAVAEVPA